MDGYIYHAKKITLNDGSIIENTRIVIYRNFIITTDNKNDSVWISTSFIQKMEGLEKTTIEKGDGIS